MNLLNTARSEVAHDNILSHSYCESAIIVVCDSITLTSRFWVGAGLTLLLAGGVTLMTFCKGQQYLYTAHSHVVQQGAAKRVRPKHLGLHTRIHMCVICP